MGINISKEYRQFYKERDLNAKKYKEAGMNESQIEEILKLDRKQFLSNIRYLKHTQSIPICANFDSWEDSSPLLDSFFNSFTNEMDENFFSKYWWIEEIENQNLLDAIRDMSPIEIELITLVMAEGYSQHCVAQMWNVTDNTIYYWIQKIRKTLAKIS